jgi:site-specific DNA recombinase
VLEGDFEVLVQSLQHTQGLFDLTKEMFKDVWDQRIAFVGALQSHTKDDIKKTDAQIESLLVRIADTAKPSVISAYETRIGELERQNLLLCEKLTKQVNPAHAFEELFELCLAFLANHWEIWDSGPYNLKRIAPKFAPIAQISYARDSVL